MDGDDNSLSETVPLLFSNDSSEPTFDNGHDSHYKSVAHENVGEIVYISNPNEMSMSGDFNTSRLVKTISCHDVVCVFVVAFDTRAGNLVEWSIPEDADLEGIEFKAMTSGSHNISQDFVYFRKGKLFGLSCFQNIRVDSEIERGARMKSVGILTASFNNLHFYRTFLQSQIRHKLSHRLHHSPHQSNVIVIQSSLVQRPGNYEELQRFYNKYKGVSVTFKRQQAFSIGPTTQFTSQSPNCYSLFVNEFKEQIFLLWKSVLLRKRILFFSQPPIEVACHKVFCTNCLSFQTVPELSSTPSANVFFYINVADIELVESTECYIACTADKILESKPRLSDVSVSNLIVVPREQELIDVLTITAADRAHYNKLNYKLKESRLFQSGDSSTDEHSIFTSFFTELNNRLFRTLYDVSNTPGKILLGEHIVEMGLDPCRDRNFLLKLAHTYNIEISLEKEKLCCPFCPRWCC